VSLAPFRIKVTGRVKHFISAFGEHVIGKEVEQAMQEAVATHGGRVTEFHVAPEVNPGSGGMPYHEWFVEFGELPGGEEVLGAFAKTLDVSLQRQNIYYADLREGNVLASAKLRVMRQGAFRRYMESQGKLGGQNKVPRLADNRLIADALD
jgi:hypothetical protein